MSQLDDLDADVVRYKRCVFASERRVAWLKVELQREQQDLEKWRGLVISREAAREKLVAQAGELRSRRVNAAVVRIKHEELPDRIGLQAPAGPVLLKPLSILGDDHG